MWPWSRSVFTETSISFGCAFWSDASPVTHCGRCCGSCCWTRRSPRLLHRCELHGGQRGDSAGLQGEVPQYVQDRTDVLAGHAVPELGSGSSTDPHRAETAPSRRLWTGFEASSTSHRNGSQERTGMNDAPGERRTVCFCLLFKTLSRLQNTQIIL